MVSVHYLYVIRVAMSSLLTGFLFFPLRPSPPCRSTSSPRPHNLLCRSFHSISYLFRSSTVSPSIPPQFTASPSIPPQSTVSPSIPSGIHSISFHSTTIHSISFHSTTIHSNSVLPFPSQSTVSQSFHSPHNPEYLFPFPY